MSPATLISLAGAPARRCAVRTPRHCPSTGTRPPGEPSRGALTRRRLLALLREVALLAVLLGLYSVARLAAGQDVGAAFRSAGRVLELERWLHLPQEQDLQVLLLDWQPLARAANLYYAFAHLPVTGLALAYLFLRRPTYYLWARRALVSATGIALAVYLLLPVAPPRMLTSAGFIDIGALLHQSVYSGTSASFTNQYAAMPSLHVGWSVLVATVCIASAHSRWRWLWVLHPLITVFVVVSTGNHYWLDGIAGLAVVTLTLVVTRTPPAFLSRLRGSRPGPARQLHA